MAAYDLNNDGRLDLLTENIELDDTGPTTNIFLALADAVDGPVPRGPFTPWTYVITAAHGGLVGRQGTDLLVSEILALREKLSIAPLTSSDLIHQVREEEQQSYGKPR